MRHPNAVSLADLGYLLEGPVLSPTVGDLTWSFAGRRAGMVEVAACVRTVTGTLTQMTFPVQRPWLVTFLYLGNGVCLRRVCVNNGHKERVWGRTHMHTYEPSTGGESTITLTSFPTPSPHTEAVDIPLREMFFAFATLSHIDASGLQWSDPPEVSGGAQ